MKDSVFLTRMFRLEQWKELFTKAKDRADFIRVLQAMDELRQQYIKESPRIHFKVGEEVFVSGKLDNGEIFGKRLVIRRIDLKTDHKNQEVIIGFNFALPAKGQRKRVWYPLPVHKFTINKIPGN